MTILSKIDKEVLATMFVLLVMIILIGFTAYSYIFGSATKIQNSIGGAQTEKKIVNINP